MLTEISMILRSAYIKTMCLAMEKNLLLAQIIGRFIQDVHCNYEQVNKHVRKKKSY